MRYCSNCERETESDTKRQIDKWEDEWVVCKTYESYCMECGSVRYEDIVIRKYLQSMQYDACQ